MKHGATIEQKYLRACQILDPGKAAVHLALCAADLMRNAPHLTFEEALKIERSNIAYCAGYFDDTTRERVERLFNCEHPLFGAIAQHGAPTPEQAFEMGQKLAALSTTTEKEK